MYVDSLIAASDRDDPPPPSCGAGARLAAEQSALRRVAALGAARASQEALLAAVNEELARLVGAGAASLLRFEADDVPAVVADWSAVDPPAPTAWRPPEAALRSARATGRPVRFGHRQPAGGLASVAVPIAIDGRPWGLSVVTPAAGVPLPDDAEARVVAFAELVATAIANAEARSELRRLADEQRALRRVATLVARDATQADVFDAVAVEAARALGEESIALLRYEPEGYSTLVAFHGGRARLDMPVLRDGLGIAAVVRRTGRPARVDCGAAVPGMAAALARDIGMRAAVGAPIAVAGRTWGLIVAMSWDAPLPSATEDRLAQFAELVATAIDNAERRAELTASRARVVAAADETRRRVERDLHDGAQQRLVHTVITLKLATAALDGADARAAALVRESLEQAERATAELRALVHGILPAALIDGGLRRGVESLVGLVDLPVHVEVGRERLPAAVETTAYFVVAEALTNAAKHARANRAHVRAQVCGEALRLEVRDDGTGGADPTRGSGLVGLGDRVAAAGGTITITSPPGGGTTLDVALPIPRA